MTGTKSGIARLPFPCPEDIQSMGLWECLDAHEAAITLCHQKEKLHNLSQGLSERTTREYHAALVQRNLIGEQLIKYVEHGLKYGDRILSHENLESYGEEVAHDVARTDIVIKSLESSHRFLEPVFRY